MAALTKMIVVPVDGSKNSLKSLDYLNLVFGTEHNLKINLFYVLPTLPATLAEGRGMNGKSKQLLSSVDQKHMQMAERTLAEAKEVLLSKGFRTENIETTYRKKEIGVARDICNWADKKRADSLLITTQGRSWLEAFLMGEVASKVLEYCTVCPVWLLEGSVKSKHVLVAIDSSDNALRAVDHVGFVLSGTDSRVKLFHSKRDLRRFVPNAVLKDAAGLEELWKHKAGQEIAPSIKKAHEMLIQAGLSEDQVSTKVIDGSRRPAADILEEAKGGGYGTIVVGRRGTSGVKEYSMGSVAGKVIRAGSGFAVWVVQ